MLNDWKMGHGPELGKQRIVQLSADKNETALKKMKKIMLSAIVLGGLLGAATTYAHDDSDARGGCSGRDYGSTSPYVQPSTGYYNGSYNYGAGYGYNYGYGHKALHQDLKAEHRDLHRDVQREHSAVHRDLARQRAYGVPGWQRRAEHEAAHQELKEVHREGHADLRYEHREGHYYPGR